VPFAHSVSKVYSAVSSFSGQVFPSSATTGRSSEVFVPVAVGPHVRGGRADPPRMRLETHEGRLHIAAAPRATALLHLIGYAREPYGHIAAFSRSTGSCRTL
jgi:hypothetical protein